MLPILFPSKRGYCFDQKSAWSITLKNVGKQFELNSYALEIYQLYQSLAQAMAWVWSHHQDQCACPHGSHQWKKKKKKKKKNSYVMQSSKMSLNSKQNKIYLMVLLRTILYKGNFKPFAYLYLKFNTSEFQVLTHFAWLHHILVNL